MRVEHVGVRYNGIQVSLEGGDDEFVDIGELLVKNFDFFFKVWRVFVNLRLGYAKVRFGLVDVFSVDKEVMLQRFQENLVKIIKEKRYTNSREFALFSICIFPARLPK